MTINFENNITIIYYDGYEREDYSHPLINLYLALPMRIIMSLAIIISASTVLLAINNSRRAPLTLRFFFIANLMIADIAVAVIYNGAAIMSMILTIANPMREGTDCRIIAFTGFPVATDTIMLLALCFDHCYRVTAPHHYRRNMTKRIGYVIIVAIWLITFLLTFLIFFDPDVNRVKTKDALCYNPIFTVIILPQMLSILLLEAKDFCLCCSEVVTTTRSDTNNSSLTIAGESETLKEKKKEATILSVISLFSVVFWIFHHVISLLIQHQAGAATWAVIIVPSFYSFCIFLHSALYVCLVDIHKSLGLNISE